MGTAHRLFRAPASPAAGRSRRSTVARILYCTSPGTTHTFRAAAAGCSQAAFPGFPPCATRASASALNGGTRIRETSARQRQRLYARTCSKRRRNRPPQPSAATRARPAAQI
ncbi:hypothetical protein MRX96_012488 [Rhipicephalus microplus]